VVNGILSIDPDQFVDLVREPIQSHDTAALARLIHDRWSQDQIICLLDSPRSDARKLAALALGFVGDRRSVTALARCLRDADAVVNQMAEHALWTVWFRAGTKLAQEHVQRGSDLIAQKLVDEAIVEFTAASRIDPTYAEARNQRAIAHYLLEDYHASIDEGQVAVQLMPTHFNAWSNLGHSWAQLSDVRRAASCYRRALGINPYLCCVREIMKEIQTGRCAFDLNGTRR